MKNATARKTKLSDIDQRWLSKLRRDLRQVGTKGYLTGETEDGKRITVYSSYVRGYIEHILIPFGKAAVARAKKVKGGR